MPRLLLYLKESLVSKYPNIKVKLTGCDGNAFTIIGAVCYALQKNKIGKDIVEQFKDEAMSGDYNTVIQTAMRWVDVY